MDRGTRREIIALRREVERSSGSVSTPARSRHRRRKALECSCAVPDPRARRLIAAFDRRELVRILDLYGRMVAAGHWRDYGISFSPDAAVFAAFRRASERPEMRIEKRPALRLKQGMFALIGEHGVVLKRGHDLSLSWPGGASAYAAGWAVALERSAIAGAREVRRAAA